MNQILIVDQNKSSQVMTSEVFKDSLSGSVIHIARSGQDALLHLKNYEETNMVVIDFDLPDSDGVTLAKLIREFYKGPILLTAFPEDMKSEEIIQEIFYYHDLSEFVPKPVRLESLAKRIEAYLVRKRRVQKRFITELPCVITTKASGRGKKPLKYAGCLVNISVGGALFKSNKEKITFKSDETISIDLNQAVVPATDKKSGKLINTTEIFTDKRIKKLDLKSLNDLKAKVIWYDGSKTKFGLQFTNLTDTTKIILEHIMKKSTPVES